MITNVIKVKLMFKTAFPIFLLLLLTACTSPKVILYAKYLTPEQQKLIEEKLKATDLNVEANQLDFPKDIITTTLLYSPISKSQKKVDQTIKVFDDLGWPIISTSPLFTNNHWIKANSIGVFVVPDGITPNSGETMNDIAGRYKGENCQKEQLSISLKENGSYRITGQLKDKGLNTGRWKVTSFPYIELHATNQEWWFYFEVKRDQHSDQLGLVNTTTLNPANNYYVLNLCTFVSGIRS